MLAWIRRQLSPATVMAFVALVFAMTGGAFAVSGNDGGSGAGAPRASASSVSVHAVTAKKKKASAGKPGPRGPAGPAGAQGPAGPAGATGPQGPAGTAGAAGAKGENGAAGTNGTNGTNGTSVTSGESKTKIGGPCEAGGSSFTSASGKTYACDGKEGSPWTAGGTLPVGATETGAWFVEGVKKSKLEPNKLGPVAVVASFPIELAAALGEGHFHYINEAGLEVTHITFNSKFEPEGEETAPQTACPGSIEEPKAVSGNLCIYSTGGGGGLFAATELIAAPPDSEGTVGRTGAVVDFLVTEGNSPHVGGSWAVTG